MARRKKHVRYRKARSGADTGGVLIGQPGVSRATAIQDYNAMANQASSQYANQKANSSTAVGSSSAGRASTPAIQSSSGTDYKQFADQAATSAASTPSAYSDAPVQPGGDPRLMQTLQGVGKGAALGASIGSVFPGFGTVIGAGIGALAGGISGLIKGSKMKKEGEKAYEEALTKRREEMALYQKAKNTSLRNYNANKTANFMSQADNMYSSTGKTIGIARRGGIVYSPIIGVRFDTPKVERVNYPITASNIRKAAKGAKVSVGLEKRVMLCSRADGSCSIRRKEAASQVFPIFKRGGSVVNKLKRNIIPHGVLHEEENMTGIKGDKGIPIVQNGKKMFELERSEFVLNAETSKDVQDKVYAYLKKPDDNILMDLGALVRKELLLNTYSYDPDYAYLNH